jgi:hypothetical protein
VSVWDECNGWKGSHLEISREFYGGRYDFCFCFRLNDR